MALVSRAPARIVAPQLGAGFGPLLLSAFAEEVGVKLGLGLAKGGVGRAPVEELLAVSAGGALHDVDGLEVEVAAVGVGRVVG